MYLYIIERKTITMKCLLVNFNILFARSAIFWTLHMFDIVKFTIKSHLEFTLAVVINI